MLLSADVFSGVIERLGAVPVRDASGQRREPRVTIDARLTILPCPDGVDAPHGPPLAVPVRNLSRGGVRILLPRRLPLDTQFVLCLPRGGEDAAPLTVLTGVAYWQPIAKDLFALGAEFLRVVTDVRVPATPPRLVLPGWVAGGAQPRRRPAG